MNMLVSHVHAAGEIRLAVHRNRGYRHVILLSNEHDTDIYSSSGQSTEFSGTSPLEAVLGLGTGVACGCVLLGTSLGMLLGMSLGSDFVLTRLLKAIVRACHLRSTVVEEASYWACSANWKDYSDLSQLNCTNQSR
jgi:hypothetical protein